VEVNKKHYYFDVKDYGDIVDSHLAYEEAAGRPVELLTQHIKDVWSAKFRLYSETENILQRVKDPSSTLFPLYRNLGEDPEDFIFDTREAAESEYRDHISQSVADRLYDL